MPYRSAILAAVEDLKDHQTGSPASSIRRRIKDHDAVFAAAVADDADDRTTWNETLFQTTLKSLVATNVLVQVNGSNYKYSDDRLRRRAEDLRARVRQAGSIEEERKGRTRAHRGVGASSSPCAREEPPKDLPKRKTVHAKVKLNEGRIITVLNAQEAKGRKDEDEMETDDEDGIREEVLSDRAKRGVKIIPRKVGAKKMISDPMTP